MTNEEKNEDVSFEELLKESTNETGWLEPGEQVEVQIVDISSDWVFLGLGGKSEGLLDKKELLDENGEFPFKIGDKIAAYFLSSRHGEFLFTTRITSGEAGRNYLGHAWDGKIPVEGLVEKEIKGGFQIKIAGDTRAFCPYSQMGHQRVEDAEPFIGQKMTFKIIEYGEKGRNIIVSHRVILEEERQKQKEALRESLEEGMTVQGEITSIRKFGAFVDIGGLEGLIPISEISWGRVEDTESVLSVGQKVDVAIMKLDWANDKFSFSLKEIQPDPWINMGQIYSEGSTHKGKVARLAQFGATEELINSKTIWICSACLQCSTRCPKGIEVAKVMEALRSINLRKRVGTLDPNQIEAKDLQDLPPIALVGAFRKLTG